MTEHDSETPGESTPEAPARGGWSSFDSTTPWDDMKVPPPSTREDRPAWGAPEPDPATGWFVDDVPAPKAAPAAAVLPRRPPIPRIPALITSAVLCLGVLLIVSSIIWHPQGP